MARRQFQRNSSSRPNRSWVGHTSSTYTTLAANTRLLVAGFIAVGGDETVLRTVGQLSVTSDQAGSVEDQIGAFGLVAVSDAAFAVGISAIPDPISRQSDDGWFVYQAFTQQGDASATSSLPRTYNFDSKAKRIISLEGVTIVISLTNASLSHGIKFALNLRILSQLRGTR